MSNFFYVDDWSILRFYRSGKDPTCDEKIRTIASLSELEELSQLDLERVTLFTDINIDTKEYTWLKYDLLRLRRDNDNLFVDEAVVKISCYNRETGIISVDRKLVIPSDEVVITKEQIDERKIHAMLWSPMTF